MVSVRRGLLPAPAKYRVFPPQSPGQPTQPSGSADSSYPVGRRLCGLIDPCGLGRGGTPGECGWYDVGDNRSTARLSYTMTTSEVPSCVRHPGV